MKRWSAIVLAIILILIAVIANGEEVWVLCQPDSYVNVRVNPSKNAQVIGRIDCGDQLETDGKEKDGWLHLVGLSLEESDGWIKKGYVTYYEPVFPENRTFFVCSRSRVACRKTINGNIRKWLYNGDDVLVYCYSDWAVTNKGFVMMDYLEEVVYE